MTDLLRLFGTLPVPGADPSSELYATVPIPRTRHRIGRACTGSPALLLDLDHPTDEPPIVLEHVDVRHGARCRVMEGGSSVGDAVYSIVRCTSSDEELWRYFVRMVAPLVEVLAADPSPGSVSRAVMHLVSLFRAIRRPPSGTVQGLFGELVVLRYGSDPATLLTAWHARPEERFDFCQGPSRIEVKTSGSRARAHHFSLEQLAPVHGATVVVASAFVERAGGGCSVEDMVDGLRALLPGHPALLGRMDAIIAETLGADWQDAGGLRFDLELARSSVAFYSAADVPRVALPLPAGVSKVEFLSDLSGCEPILHEQLRLLGGLLAAVVPGPAS